MSRHRLPSNILQLTVPLLIKACKESFLQEISCAHLPVLPLCSLFKIKQEKRCLWKVLFSQSWFVARFYLFKVEDCLPFAERCILTQSDMLLPQTCCFRKFWLQSCQFLRNQTYLLCFDRPSLFLLIKIFVLKFPKFSSWQIRQINLSWFIGNSLDHNIREVGSAGPKKNGLWV